MSFEDKTPEERLKRFLDDEDFSPEDWTDPEDWVPVINNHLHGLYDDDFLVRTDEWVDDAMGYIAEPGLLGSEILDDVFGIICPPFGMIDILQETAVAVMKGYNVTAENYNELRHDLIHLVETVEYWKDAFDHFTEYWLPESIEDEIEDTTDPLWDIALEMAYMTRHIAYQFPELEYIPEEVIDYVDVEWSPSQDPHKSFLERTQENKPLYRKQVYHKAKPEADASQDPLQKLVYDSTREGIKQGKDVVEDIKDKLGL
jgi:hypothetical protein